VTTGEPDNVVVIRKGAETEIQSAIDRQQANALEMHPAVALDPDGRPMVSKEAVVLISLVKASTGKPSNVVIRGVSPAGLMLRPRVKLVAGRMFAPGSSEIVVGSAIANGFSGAQLGDRLHFAQRDWTVVGIFDAGGSGFDSEIWGDVDQLMQSFRRTSYSSMVLRLATPTASTRFRPISTSTRAWPTKPSASSLLQRPVEGAVGVHQHPGADADDDLLGRRDDRRDDHDVRVGGQPRRRDRHAARARLPARQRARGLPDRGAAAGLGAGGVAARASLMGFASFSTTNFQTFSDLSFRFVLTPAIVVKTLSFSLVMGLVGGLLPALRAARMSIVDALRAQ
jgi:putative ABC transport system permease protein